MQPVFIPKVIQNYKTIIPGTFPLGIRQEINPICDTFQKQQKSYSEDEKFDLLRENKVNGNILFHAANYNNTQFEHAIRILKKHKVETPLELDCLVNYPKEKFEYALKFLNFGINPIEIKQVLDIDNNYKILFNELSKIQGLSENYKDKSFNIQVGTEDKRIMAIINWAQDGENITDRNNPDAIEVVLIKQIDENGKVNTQRCEIIPNDFLKSNSKNGNIVFDTKIQNEEIQEQFEISDTKIIHKKLSDVFQGLYDITSYDFQDFDEDIDIKDGIKKGALQGKILSKAIQNSDEEKTYYENYNDIKRHFHTYKDGYEYSYTTPFMNFSRSFKKISDNITETIVNDKRYLVEFEDKNQIIKINGEKTIDIGNMTDFNPDLWKICKDIPGDILNHFDIVKHWELCDNMKSYWQTNNQTLASGDDIGIIAHEIGHAIDRMKLNISDDPKLMEIFSKEKEDFYNKYTFPSGIDSMYHLFDEYDNAKEMVAETNLLLTNPGNNLYRKTRCQILAQHFPETIGYIAARLTA